MDKKKAIGIIAIILLLIIGIVLIVYVSKDKNKDTKEVTAIENTNGEGSNNKEEIKAPEEYDNEVPILCYHGVLDEAWGDTSIFVKVEEFEKQMKYLSENGYTTLFISEIEDANRYEKPIVITFDDGYRDVYTNAFPILQKYNIKADLYIISGFLNGDAYLTTDMVKELVKSPLIEFGSHTITHSILTKQTEEEVERQLRESKQILEEITGKKVDSMAYPTGAYNAKIIETVKKYYKYAISIEVGKEKPKNLNTYELKRLYMLRDYKIEEFVELIK